MSRKVQKGARSSRRNKRENLDQGRQIWEETRDFDDGSLHKVRGRTDCVVRTGLRSGDGVES